MLPFSTKLDDFIDQYQALFGEFPGKGNEMKYWKEFIAKVPLEKIGPLMDEVDKTLGENIAKPRMRYFRKAFDNLKTKTPYVNHAREEAAKTLGIPLARLPEHGNDLNDYQRKTLRIPTHENGEKMLSDVSKIAAGDMKLSEYYEKWQIPRSEWDMKCLEKHGDAPNLNDNPFQVC